MKITRSLGSLDLSGFTDGSVLFADGGAIAENNAEFYFDTTNHRLGLGQNASDFAIDVNGFTSLRTSFVIREEGSDNAWMQALMRNGSGPARQMVAKSRGTSDAPTVVIDGDAVAEWQMVGYNDDLSRYNHVAILRASVDGTVGSDKDMPGRLEFHTNDNSTADMTISAMIDSNKDFTTYGQLRVDPGSDTDTNIITVDVTGTPTMSWNETGDAFEYNKGVIFSPGSDTDITLVTVNVTGQPTFRWDESEDEFILGANVTIEGDIYTQSVTFEGDMSEADWGMFGIRVTGTGLSTFTNTSTAASGTVSRATTVVLSQGTIAATNSNVTYTEYYGAYCYEPTAGTNVTFSNRFALGAQHIKVDAQPVAAISSNLGAIYVAGTTEYTAAGNYAHPAVQYASQADFTTSPNAYGAGFLFWNKATYNYTNSNGAFSVGPSYTLVDQKLTEVTNASATKTCAFDISILVNPTYRSTGTGTLTVSAAYGLRNNFVFDSRSTATELFGAQFLDVTLSDTETTSPGTVTSHAAICVADLVNATNNTSLLLGTSTIPTGDWSIYQADTKVNRWNGGHRFKRRISTTTNQSLSSADHYTSSDNNAGTTVTLPGANAGLHQVVVNANTAGGAVLVQANSGSGDSIEGGDVTLYNRGDAITLYAESSSLWRVVSRYQQGTDLTTVTGDYTLLWNDRHIDCNSTSAILITEVANPVHGQMFTVTNVNTGAVTFSFDISGDSSLSLGQWEGVTFRYNSTISKWVATEY